MSFDSLYQRFQELYPDCVDTSDFGRYAIQSTSGDSALTVAYQGGFSDSTNSDGFTYPELSGVADLFPQLLEEYFTDVVLGA